jgi:hypothetical protein
MTPGLDLFQLNEHASHVVQQKLPINFLFEILDRSLFSQLVLQLTHGRHHCSNCFLAQFVHTVQKLYRFLDTGQKVEFITGAHYRKGSGE